MARLFAFSIRLTVASLAFAASVDAHPRLMASNPANGAVVRGIGAIRLQFSETLVPAFSGGELATNGRKLPLKSMVSDKGHTLVLSSTRPLAPGSYQLNWHAVSTDTHRVTGALSFKVK